MYITYFPYLILLEYLYGIVTTGRDWHFLLYSPGQISKASDTALTIEFTKKALEKNSEEYHALRKNVKKVLGVVVGLLKDRACVEKSPAKKRARVEEYRAKKWCNSQGLYPALWFIFSLIIKLQILNGAHKKKIYNMLYVLDFGMITAS